MFSDAEASAKYPLHAFKKQVETIISKNHSYFASLRDVAEIVFIGHSLNDVDLPYFREIVNCAPTCRWVVYGFEGHITAQAHVALSRMPPSRSSRQSIKARSAG